MSQRGSLDHLQIEATLNTFAVNQNRNITFAQVGSSDKVSIQDAQTNGSDELQKLLQELEGSSQQSSRCSVHPEEDIQFYCYTNGSTLCAECLLKRNYTGLEVMNLRRATERLRGELGYAVMQAFGRTEVSSEFQGEVERYQVQIEETIENYKEEVVRKMTAIREALAIKEKELIDRLDVIKKERLQMLGGSSASRPQKGNITKDITALKELIETDVKGFSDLALCKLYSRKLASLKTHNQNEDTEENLHNERNLMEYFESQDHANFSKYEENLHEVLTDIQTLSCEVINNHYNPVNLNLESLESASMERLQFQRNVYHSSSFAKDRDYKLINIIQNTSRPHHQKVTSFISSPIYGEIETLKSHTNLSSKPSLIADFHLGKNEGTKHYAPIISSYREQLAKVTGKKGLTSSSNRNSLIDIASIIGNQEKPQQQQQQQSSKPKITPQKFYIDSFLTSRTPRLASARPKGLESSIDQIEQAMTARASSQKGILKYTTRRDSGGGLSSVGSEKTLIITPKLQSSKAIEFPGGTDKGNLRQRLSNLNAKLFN